MLAPPNDAALAASDSPLFYKVPTISSNRDLFLRKPSHHAKKRASVVEAPDPDQPLVSARLPCRCEPRSLGEPAHQEGGNRRVDM